MGIDKGDYQLPSGIVIPGAKVSSIRAVEDVFFCATCEALGERRGFPRERAAEYQAHVIKCAEEHEEELRGLSLRHGSRGIFGDEGWDTEHEQWIRDNARGILEGKVRV